MSRTLVPIGTKQWWETRRGKYSKLIGHQYLEHVFINIEIRNIRSMFINLSIFRICEEVGRLKSVLESKYNLILLKKKANS